MMLKSKLLQTPTYQHLHCAKRPLRCSKKRNLGGHVPIAMACFESWVGPQSRKVALSNTAGKAYKTYHHCIFFHARRKLHTLYHIKTTVYQSPSGVRQWCRTPLGDCTLLSSPVPTIRYFSDLTYKHTVVSKGETLDIFRALVLSPCLSFSVCL